MDTAQLEQVRDTLLQAMDNQYAIDKAAAETNQRLGQQQLMYSNDTRGTLYSGQPTWERAQLAAKGASNLASLGNNYLKQKLQIWDNITNTLDQIESYNKAAATLAKNTKMVNNASGASSSYIELYNSLQGGS